MNAIVAFLHHLSAFALVAALVVEFILIRDMLTVGSARKLQVADRIYGATAVALLVLGFLRVFYYEKGSFYYFHSIPFIAKMILFAIVGLLSIYPTRVFLAWSKELKQGQVPALSEHTQRMLRSIIHAELVGVVFIILCAALMAKGLGFRN